MAAGGGAATRLTNNPAHDKAPSLTHDGKWIYFGSNRGGQFQVWKMPAQGGDAIQITKKGGYAALESSDGQYLYYARRSPRRGNLDGTGGRRRGNAGNSGHRYAG